MSKPIITVENLSKCYALGQQRNRAEALRHILEDVVRRPLDWLKPDRTKTEFWALRNVNFEVKAGDVVGIIGRNGAGKSTLLKILSRITEPTTGRITIEGRVASLLEVGTGFHPELTGRENIFLNGAILGMTKAEIKKKFDEIVAFSEVEKFLDTPVKRYSSGMYMRLAFAVAAHLEPEILIVDEVLAVGDAAFQKKCLGKMQDVSRGGRTVLFVSHNMQAVVALCNQAVWLQDGTVLTTGPARELAASYMEKYAADSNGSGQPLAEMPRTGTGAGKFTQMTITPLNAAGEPVANVVTGGSVQIQLEVTAAQPLQEANVAITIYDSGGYRLIDVSTALKGEFLSLPAGGKARVNFILQELLLKPGRYSVELWLGRAAAEDMDYVREAGVLDMQEDIEQIQHSEVFPGSYQCRFTHRISK